MPMSQLVIEPELGTRQEHPDELSNPLDAPVVALGEVIRFIRQKRARGLK